MRSGEHSEGVLFDALRRLKHRGFVLRRDARSAGYAVVNGVRDAAWRYVPTVLPYRFPRAGYRRSFLNWDAPPSEPTTPVPRRVFVFWTGENPMPEVRQASLAQLRAEQADLEVVLVSPENLSQWIVPEHPLHPAFDGLSLVHRSDYLRAYFLHHHGGGYADVKQTTAPWSGVFERLDSSRDLWLVGYPEFTNNYVGKMTRKLGRDLRHYYRIVPGGCAFVAKAHSPLTAEWLAEVERRLDYYRDLLEQHPGGVRGEDSAYPVSWNRLLAQVLHPLSLKYHRHVRVEDAMRVVNRDYR